MDEAQSSSSPDVCFSCKKDGTETNLLKIQTKGMENVRKASAKKRDGLLSTLRRSQFVFAHKICWQYYINEGAIHSEVNKRKSDSLCSPTKNKLRICDENKGEILNANIKPDDSKFLWNKYCLFCEKEADEQKERKK